MIKTQSFQQLPADVQNLFEEPITLEMLYNPDQFALRTLGNRASIFEVISCDDLIVKWYNPKGRRDFDIPALLDLQDIDQIPKLYCYQEDTYLVMQKAKGSSVDHLLKENALKESDLTYLRKQYEDVVLAVIQKGYYDWDFKLEHIFWDSIDRRIMLIDFGAYSKDHYHETFVTKRMEHFDEQLRFYPVR